MTRHPWAVAWWTVVGALTAFSLVALLTVGPFVLPVAVVLAAVGAARPALRRGVLPGLLLGAATTPLLLAWLNRSGPGVVCESSATVQSCGEQWSPWPFLVAGLALLAAGAVLLLRSGRGRGSTAAVHEDVPGRV